MSKQKDPHGKPDADDIGMTLVIIGMMKFPPAPVSNGLIFQEIERLVGTRAQLAWLNNALTYEVKEWSGISCLREKFCQRFQPADGRDTHTVEELWPDSKYPQFSNVESRALPAGGEYHAKIREIAERRSMPGPKMIEGKLPGDKGRPE